MPIHEKLWRVSKVTGARGQRRGAAVRNPAATAIAARIVIHDAVGQTGLAHPSRRIADHSATDYVIAERRGSSAVICNRVAANKTVVERSLIGDAPRKVAGI